MSRRPVVLSPSQVVSHLPAVSGKLIRAVATATAALALTAGVMLTTTGAAQAAPAPTTSAAHTADGPGRHYDGRDHGARPGPRTSR